MEAKMKIGKNEYLTDVEYHDDREFISSSGLKLLLKNPRKFYKTYVLNEKEEKNSAALDFGHYIHSVILEPNTVKDKYAIFEGASRRGKAWEEFSKENEGKIIITKSQQELTKQLLDNYNKAEVIIGAHGYDQPVKINSFFKKGSAELSLGEVLNGIKVKVRFDYFREFSDFASIQDVKTTAKTANTAKEAEAICSDFDYDLSAALYVDIAEKICKKPTDFYFVFFSKADGQVNIYKASEQMLERGRQKYKEAIVALKNARETGQYFTNEIQELC